MNNDNNIIYLSQRSCQKFHSQLNLEPEPRKEDYDYLGFYMKKLNKIGFLFSKLNIRTLHIIEDAGLINSRFESRALYNVRNGLNEKELLYYENYNVKYNCEINLEYHNKDYHG